MINAILGKKLEMTSAFDGRGRRVPLTVIEAGPCFVIQVKTKEKDGYAAVRLGFGQRKKAKKPLLGIVQKAGIKTIPRYIKEARIQNGEEPPRVGDVIKVADIFSVGDFISASGTSKGKGFTGVVKRWGFSGGPRTHGQSDRERAPGSIGQMTTPGRVFKGKKMAGRKGGEKVTVQNLKVLEVLPEENLLKVTGAVPGAYGSLLFIKRTGEKRIVEEEKPKEQKPPVDVEEKAEESSPSQEAKEVKEENAEESPS